MKKSFIAFQYLIQEYKKKKIENVYLFKQISHVKPFLKFLGRKSLSFQMWATWMQILLGSY